MSMDPKRWKYSNIASLSIGQGELQVTPLQMANLGAILANRGYFITPHVVDKIQGWPNPNIQKEILPFDPALFGPIIKGMEQVVMAGSGRRGYLDNLKLAGKTSTVQNPHGEDHSGFMGFAPLDDPKISIAGLCGECRARRKSCCFGCQFDGREICAGDRVTSMA